MIDQAVLVTGGCGFGGSHLVRELVCRGARVVVLDLVDPSEPCPEVRYLRGDVRALSSVASVLARHEVHTVFHLAAQPLVPVSVQLPYETFDANAMGTAAVLEAARRVGTPHVVIASSGAYYGTTSADTPITESTAPLPAANLYAASKAAADLTAQGYARTYGMHIGVCRFMNTYGPGDTNRSRLVPHALHLLREVVPRGGDYDFGDRDDGSTQLDFVHVHDVVRAYLAVDAWLGGPAWSASSPMAFNIGTGTATAVRDVAAALSVAFDGVARTPVFRGAPRAVRVRKLLDPTLAASVLGWRAEVPLAQGLAEVARSGGVRAVGAAGPRGAPAA